MSVVDVQRFDRNKRHGHVSRAIRLEDEDETVANDFDIKQISNFICKPLTSGKWKFREAPQPSARVSAAVAENKPIIRITGKDSVSINYPSDHPNLKSRGEPYQGRCFICKRYKENGSSTQWKCRQCGMALCQADRTGVPGREQTCVEEHLSATNDFLACGKMQRCQFVMPEELKVYTETRSQTAKKVAKAQKQQQKRMSVTPSPHKKRRRKN